MHKERRKVFSRMSLIAWGIPAVLLVFTVVLEVSPWSIRQAQVGGRALNLVLICLAAGGLSIWAFFSLYLYGRLWKVFPYVGDAEKGWVYAEGVFGLQGVGCSMSSVLGVFLYLFGGGFWRALVMVSISFCLAIWETARFPLRIADVEELLGGMG